MDIDIEIKPKSTLALIIAFALTFVLFSGFTKLISPEVSKYFSDIGYPLLILGLGVWLIYIYRSIKGD